MKNDWILDALADMREFAVMNDMPELARQLDITAEVASRESRHLEGGVCEKGDDGIGQDLEAGSGNSTSR